MVRKGGDRHIVGGNDTHFIPVLRRRVRLPVHLKRDRRLPEIRVHYRIEPFLPVVGKRPVRIPEDRIHIGLRGRIQFPVDGKRLQSRHGGLRNKSPILDHMQNIARFGSGAETNVSVGPDVFHSTLLVGLAHHEHLGKIRIISRVFEPLDPDRLRLQISKG